MFSHFWVLNYYIIRLSVKLLIKSYLLISIKSLRICLKRLVFRKTFTKLLNINLIFKAISSIAGVSGLLNFAFPTETASGARGDVEDLINLTYCPTLFVVGQNASDFCFDSMNYLRKIIKVDTGLVVVGGANHNLFVSALRLNLERVSQKLVDRKIVVELF